MREHTHTGLNFGGLNSQADIPGRDTVIGVTLLTRIRECEGTGTLFTMIAVLGYSRRELSGLA